MLPTNSPFDPDHPLNTMKPRIQEPVTELVRPARTAIREVPTSVLESWLATLVEIDTYGSDNLAQDLRELADAIQTYLPG